MGMDVPLGNLNFSEKGENVQNQFSLQKRFANLPWNI